MTTVQSAPLLPQLPLHLVSRILACADIDVRRSLRLPPRQLRRHPRHRHALVAVEAALRRKLTCELTFDDVCKTAFLVSGNLRTIYAFTYDAELDLCVIASARLSPRMQVRRHAWGWPVFTIECEPEHLVDCWVRTYASWLDARPHLEDAGTSASWCNYATAANAEMVATAIAALDGVCPRSDDIDHDQDWHALPLVTKWEAPWGRWLRGVRDWWHEVWQVVRTARFASRRD